MGVGSVRKVLVLGGGVFLGRHVVSSLLAAGHDVTVFHRGRTSSSEVPPGVRRVLGSRESDLPRVAEQAWDAVVDTCAYLPQHVSSALRTLRTTHYVLVSSVSVYASFTDSGENGELRPARQATAVSGHDYGGLKVACERALQASSVPRCIVRCGLMTGPLDVSSTARCAVAAGPTDLAYDSFAGRLPYWCWRTRRGGTMLAPGSPNAPVQVLDARDAADWMVRVVERATTGTFNLVGRQHTFEEWLGSCLRASPGPADDPTSLQWVDDDDLLRMGVRPGPLLPLWNPPDVGAPGFFDVPDAAALEHGLARRPVEQTLAELASWFVTSHSDARTVLGDGSLTADQEYQLLAWSRDRRD